MMQEKIDNILAEIESFNTQSADELEQFRIRMLGSKNVIKDLFNDFKDVPNDQKKAVGQALNQLKVKAQEKYDGLKSGLGGGDNGDSTDIDFTLPGAKQFKGSRHPLTIVRNEIVDIFSRIGFEVSDGPEIEDDWHNFTALNFPPEHPARDMQDTFFVPSIDGEPMALRTHTSSVQVRVMENNQPPIRTISPGRVYRHDNDSTHSPVFHQVEGLYIDEGVSFADLKQTLYFFVKEMLGSDIEVRFRPSFFPFTEPSAEMDIAWKKGGKKAWMEILGCGMVDVNVLDNCGIDSSKFTGYAFGMGIERIAMLKYGIQDIRLFYQNDQRFLRQFHGL